MINGVRVRDSGVELSPTGTDRRGGPRTASNRTVRVSSAIAAGSTRWLMRRTKRPLSASLEEWPVLAVEAAPLPKLVDPLVVEIGLAGRRSHDRAGAMDEQTGQVLVPARFEMPISTLRSPLENCRRTRPTQAARQMACPG